MTEKRKPWSKWYWGDWRKDVRLHRCSYAARGLWADMLSLMGGECDHFGCLILEGQALDAGDLASLLGGSNREVAKMLTDLEAKNVFSRVGGDMPEDVEVNLPAGLPQGTIVSRRMIRDRVRDEKDKTSGEGGGNPDIRRGSVPKAQRARPYRRSDNPAKTRRIFDKDGGKCHWCGVTLIYEGALAPNLYHVDHIIPVADGGTSEEQNLCAACADCNHKRARTGWPFSVVLVNPDPLLQSDSNVRQRPTGTSDTKAQRPEARGQKPDTPPKQEESQGNTAREADWSAIGQRAWEVAGCDKDVNLATTSYGIVRQWLADGADETLILEVIKRVRTKNRGAVKRLEYYGPAVAEDLAKRRAMDVTADPERLDADTVALVRSRIALLREDGWSGDEIGKLKLHALSDDAFAELRASNRPADRNDPGLVSRETQPAPTSCKPDGSCHAATDPACAFYIAPGNRRAAE